MADERPELGDALGALRIDPARKAGAHGGRRRVGGVLLAAAGVAGGLGLAASRLVGGAAEVEVGRAIRQDPALAATVLTVGGYIIPHRKIDLSPKITGRVEWIGVERGDRVTAGTVLVRLDQAEHKAALAQAQAALALARARLRELEAGSRREEIEQARANVEQAESNLANARLNLDRLRLLWDDGAVARQLVDNARNQFEVALAQLKAAQQAYDMARTGPRPEQIEQARAQVALAQAALAQANSALENTVIRAPEGGTVLERLVQVGETVTSGFIGGRGAKSAILSMANLHELDVELDVNQNDVGKLRLGQPAVVIADAYPDRKYRGTLSEIAPEANRQKATLQVKVRIAEPDEWLRPEMNAKVLFQDPARPGGARPRVLVPKDAVGSSGGAPMVFLVRNGQAVARRVKTGAESGGLVEVLDGLQGGEDVVTSGLDSLRDGQKVKVKR
jgi:HlyD family secretion protein